MYMIRNDQDQDDINDSIEDTRARLKAASCACGGDMPGRCPGRHNCPMVDQEEEESE